MAKRILLFGGTFDPPHLAHTQMVQTILDRQLFDEVWYIPVGRHDTLFVKPGMGKVSDRLAMLKMVAIPHTKIETYEIDSGKTSFTHSTLRRLSQLYPESKFSWLMGSDQLAKLDLWDCADEEKCFPKCADEFDYYVYPRAGFPLILPFANLKVIKDVEPMAVSSTAIRSKVKAGQSITQLVSPAVAAYIKEHHLYQSTD